MSEDLSLLLGQLAAGDPSVLDRVVQILYDDLRDLARVRLRNEREGHTLGATALVNEVYLRLARQHRIESSSRTQFFAIAATTMRRVLVDYARARKTAKRGGEAEHVPMEQAEPFLSDEEADEVLALEEALSQLSAQSPRAAQVVEHRFFSGLTVAEIADVLGVAEKTIHRDWVLARAWLRKEIAGIRDLPA